MLVTWEPGTEVAPTSSRRRVGARNGGTMKPILWAFLLLALAVPTLASADVAPIPGGCGEAEIGCSVVDLEQPGTECRACDVEDIGGSEACNVLFADTDFSYECTQDLAGIEVEIWCDGPVSSGCALQDGPARPLVPALSFVAIMAGILLIRFRRAR